MSEHTIDPLAKDLCSLSDLLNRFPKRPSPTVVWRWTKKGTRGTRLETIKIAGCLHTTETEFRCFVAAIQVPKPEPACIDSERQHAIERQLESKGYLGGNKSKS